MPNAKIYMTTQSFPPGDIRSLIGAPEHFSIGQFASYVLAETKAQAAEAIYGAHSGASTGDLRVAANRLDQIRQEDVKAFYDAGLLHTVGDVVVQSRDGRYGVVLVRGGADEDGDPVRVGEWVNRQSDEDITITSFATVDGQRFDLPTDESFRRVILEQRAKEAAERKVIADAAIAIHRVTAFIDARTADHRKLEDDAVATFGDGGRLYHITVTDLRALMAAAATVLQ